MTVKDLRTITGMSRAKFGELYGIPARSIQNWEEGKRNPPEYVLRLLDRVVREDFPGAYSDFVEKSNRE
jgi:DNA-binding transcriptional regulator YiaG